MSLAYLPEDQVQTHLANGRLVQVLADWCPPLRSVAALIARFGSAGIFRVRNLLHPKPAPSM
jgi:DNA-binding transcriptional LysR family regulator